MVRLASLHTKQRKRCNAMKILIAVLSALLVSSIAYGARLPTPPDPFAAECNAVVTSRLETSVLERTLHTQKVRFDTATTAAYVRIDVAKAIEPQWTCYTWNATLHLPAHGCFALDTSSAPGNTLERTNVARGAEVRWRVKMQGRSVGGVPCHIRGSDDEHHATIEVTVIDAGTSAAAPRPEGHPEYYFPVVLEHLGR